MKKLLSFLLCMVMLLTLAPFALAEEEPAEDPEIVGEETVDEPAAEDEPAADGAERVEAWFENGKINWKSYPGATTYDISFIGVNFGGARTPYLSEADRPFDFAAYLDSTGGGSGTYTQIRVKAGVIRANGDFELLSDSEPMTYEHTSVNPTMATPNAWWDGTTIRWDWIDFSPYAEVGGTADNIYVHIGLKEDGEALVWLRDSDGHYGVPLSVQGTSWDVSEYIERPARSYSFEISFEAQDDVALKIAYGKTVQSEAVTGQELLDGYISPSHGYTVSFVTEYGTAPAKQYVSIGRKGFITDYYVPKAKKPADPVDPSGEHVFKYWATRREMNFYGQTSWIYSEYDFSTPLTGDLTLYARWEDADPDDPEPVDPEPEVIPNTYELDLSGAQVSGSEVTGTGRMVRTGGNQPEGKRYAYIVVSYERADGSTWAVAGTYSVDADGEFDLPSITGVSDAVSGVLVIGLDAKVGANWAGHNITKPGRIKP